MIKKYLMKKIGERRTTNEGFEIVIINGGEKPGRVVVKFFEPEELEIECSYNSFDKGTLKNPKKIKKYYSEWIGKTKISDEGYEIKVIDGGSKPRTIKVMIDNKYETEIDRRHFERGNVKNLLHKSIYDFGFIGIGKFSPKTHSKIYKIWASMIRRCYSEQDPRFHNYENTEVCEEWSNFQNYAKWYEENFTKDWEVDKDLLSEDVKIYSPSTCLFLPREINTFIMNFNKSNQKELLKKKYEEKFKQYDLDQKILDLIFRI